MSDKGQTNQPSPSVNKHNNDKFRQLLMEHLASCEVCRSAKPPTHCASGRMLWNLVGRTDASRSPEYAANGFRQDRICDAVLNDPPKTMRFRPKREFGYVGFKPKRSQGV